MNHLPCALESSKANTYLTSNKRLFNRVGVQLFSKAFSWEYLDIGKESWKAGVDDGQPRSPFFASC